MREISKAGEKLRAFTDALNLRVVQGVSDEIEQFMPDSWTWAIEDDHFLVTGRRSQNWTLQLMTLCNDLSYLV